MGAIIASGILILAASMLTTWLGWYLATRTAKALYQQQLEDRRREKVARIRDDVLDHVAVALDACTRAMASYRQLGEATSGGLSGQTPGELTGFTRELVAHIDRAVVACLGIGAPSRLTDALLETAAQLAKASSEIRSAHHVSAETFAALVNNTLPTIENEIANLRASEPAIPQPPTGASNSNA